MNRSLDYGERMAEAAASGYDSLEDYQIEMRRLREEREERQEDDVRVDSLHARN